MIELLLIILLIVIVSVGWILKSRLENILTILEKSHWNQDRVKKEFEENKAIREEKLWEEWLLKKAENTTEEEWERSLKATYNENYSEQTKRYVESLRARAKVVRQEAEEKKKT